MPGERDLITATVERFSQISSLSRRSIYRLIDRGEIRAVKICGRRLIDVESYWELMARSDDRSVSARARKNGGMDGGKNEG